MRKVILGISAFYHDSAAALLIDGEIVAAAQEERFTRKKHDPTFPANAIRYILSEYGLSTDDIDVVAFYDKPFLKFERLLETYNGFAPRGLVSFLSAMPVWVKEKLFLKKMLKDELNNIGVCQPRLIFPEHHLSHAASAFYPSPFSEAAILTVDGVGEWATTTIGIGSGENITVHKELHFPHSLGLFYSSVTAFCGFKVNSGEYKLMGLAPYGNPHGEKCKYYKKLIYDNLMDVRSDGSLLLNMDYFNYATGLEMCNGDKWAALFGMPARDSEGDIPQEYMDLALAAQQVTEEVVIKLAATAKAISNSDNLVLAGGVALNCVANGKLLNTGLFKNIWIQPASGDAGGALGAALAAKHIWYGERREVPEADAMQGSYLGPEFTDADIQKMVRKFNASGDQFKSFDKLAQVVCQLLSDGNVIGWFQGRMEFGPRALGNRSILGDPRNRDMQKKLNLKIKYREGFRPFAPSVLEEEVGNYFDLDRHSPYMLLVAPVKDTQLYDLPGGYADMGMYERLYVPRSTIPAVTHVDFSARVQSVSKKTNQRYWKLIDTFRKDHGCGLVVNTSFNVRGEPIVCTPEDAYRCFMRTEMDVLVIGNFLFFKDAQPKFEEKEDWREDFELD